MRNELQPGLCGRLCLVLIDCLFWDSLSVILYNFRCKAVEMQSGTGSCSRGGCQNTLKMVQDRFHNFCWSFALAPTPLTYNDLRQRGHQPRPSTMQYHATGPKHQEKLTESFFRLGSLSPGSGTIAAALRLRLIAAVHSRVNLLSPIPRNFGLTRNFCKFATSRAARTVRVFENASGMMR